MNGRIRRKLQSNTGASLMIALLVFMMCAVAGSVILASASGSAGRMRNLDETVEDQVLLESAAQLVCAQLGSEADRVVDIQHFADDDPVVTQEGDTLASALRKLAADMYVEQWLDVDGYAARIRNSVLTSYDLPGMLTQTSEELHDHSRESIANHRCMTGTYQIRFSDSGSSGTESAVEAAVYVYRDYQVELVLSKENGNDQAGSGEAESVTTTIVLPAADVQCIVTDASARGRYVHTTILLGVPQIQY